MRSSLRLNAQTAAGDAHAGAASPKTRPSARGAHARRGRRASGYLWLTYDPALERIALEPMRDADNPLLVERVPLLTMDVWEHAYYLDYQNARNRYAEAFVTHLAN